MAWTSLARASAAALQRISGFEANPLASGSLSSRLQSRLNSSLLRSSQNGYANGHAFSGRTQYWFVHKHFMSTPRIKLKKDRTLDSVAEREKLLRPIMRIRDMILKHKAKTIPLRFLMIKRRELGLKMSDMKVQTFMKRYPNIFEFYIHPDDKKPWCRLTKEVMELLEEEKQIHAEQEPLVVEKLRKLLMLSKDKRIRVDKLEFARRDFGLPDDFLTRVVPRYPDFFRLVQGKGPLPTLELVSWDESLAISEFEKAAKEDARQRGLGEIETRGQPLAFKFSYSPGMALRKKILENLEKWQKLPYISPYQDASWVENGTSLAEKRTVALLHEVLSLTIEKKFLIEVIGRYREEFNLPQKVAKLFNRFPGVFYLSLKGAVHTIILREAFQKSYLIEEHPLVKLKAKYVKLVKDGPRLRSIQSKAKQAGIVSEENNEGDEENSDEQLDDGESSDEFFDSEGDDDDASGGDDGYDDAESQSEDEKERRVPRRAAGKVQREVW